MSATSTMVRIGDPSPRREELEILSHRDKAITQRATVLASLADGPCRVAGVGDSADVLKNLRALREWGVEVRDEGEEVVYIDGRSRLGEGWQGRVDCANSATTARILTAVFAAGRGIVTVEGNEVLTERPMGWAVDSLRAMGADISYLGRDGRLPLRVAGTELEGGTHDVEVCSAQAVSVLAFASLSGMVPTLIRRRALARDHTERLLRWTGSQVEESGLDLAIEPVRPRPFELAVPRDPSGAAVLAAIHLASSQAEQWLHLPGLCINERRIGFFTIVARMGVEVAIEQVDESGPEPVGTVSVRRTADLAGVVVEGDDLIQSAIDELPLIAALATQAAGPTTIRDAAELRDKDCDRIAATAWLLGTFGGSVGATEDGLHVTPSRLSPPGAPVVLPRDHRMAFVGLVLAILVGGQVSLSGMDSIATSFPGVLAAARHYVEIG